MNTETYKISLSYKQILDLVKQLPKKDKAKLSKELAMEAKDIRLSRLLDAFYTEEINEEEINSEIEKVRAEIYANK